MHRRVTAFAVAALALATSARGELNGLLYDPQPPASSAYVRVINAAPDAIDVAVDGKARVTALPTGEASDYLVLPAGKRVLSVSAGKSSKRDMALEIAEGRAITVAVRALASDAKPWIFEDKANTNKLKAVVAVYYLADKGAPIDVGTADGTVKVFTAIAPGSSTGRAVNPIKVDLVATAAGAAAPLARASLSMAPGGTYTWMLLKGKAGLEAHAFQNKVERYTGRQAASN